MVLTVFALLYIKKNKSGVPFVLVEAIVSLVFHPLLNSQFGCPLCGFLGSQIVCGNGRT